MHPAIWNKWNENLHCAGPWTHHKTWWWQQHAEIDGKMDGCSCKTIPEDDMLESEKDLRLEWSSQREQRLSFMWIQMASQYFSPIRRFNQTGGRNLTQHLIMTPLRTETLNDCSSTPLRNSPELVVIIMLLLLPFRQHSLIVSTSTHQTRRFTADGCRASSWSDRGPDQRRSKLTRIVLLCSVITRHLHICDRNVLKSLCLIVYKNVWGDGK